MKFINEKQSKEQEIYALILRKSVFLEQSCWENRNINSLGAF